MYTVLEADYSAALTLLLKYPIPAPPHGPATFVSDALYLRDNLLLDGGDHIISKYSRRAPETTVTRKLPKKVKRARTAEQEAAQNALLPRTTPAKLFQDQGGIEGIIHEAAKGVYSRGEKWGVGKALRGAMQGLQSGRSSPRRISERRQRSLDHGKSNSDSPDEMVAKIQALESRNRSLAKLLETAVDELWVQQKKMHEEYDEAAADGLSLSMAKVQFVQVYLENATMPLPSDTAPSAEDTGEGTTSAPTNKTDTLSSPQKTVVRSTQLDGSSEEKEITADDPSKAPNPSFREIPTVHKPIPPSTPKIGSPSKASSSAPRPSLEQSPFSWMLGANEPQKSGFVAASPFQQAEKTSSGSSKRLFGDIGRKKSRGRPRPKNGQTERAEDDEDDVFTMGLGKERKGM